jgi:hypothetical protein
MRLRVRHIFASLVLLAASGCSDATDPTSRRNAAGTYVLDSVIGRGAVSGTFTLTSDGRAERRVRYAGNPVEYVETGTFDVAEPSIVFALHEQGDPYDVAWQVRGELLEGRFTFRYPDPADGPDIVETYRR